MAPADFRDRFADRAHAAANETPAAGAFVLAHDVMQDDVGRARRLRTRKRADRAVVAEHRPRHAVFEPAREEIVGAHRQEVDEPVELLADPAILPRELEELAPALEVASRRIDRRVEQEPAHDVRGLVEPRVELRVDLAVVTRESCELRRGFPDVAAEHDVIIGTDRAEEVSRRQDRQSEIAQSKVPDDLRVQQAHDVGKSRCPETRRKFLRDGGTADQRPALEDKDFLAGLRKVSAAGEAVVAAADDNCVKDCARHRRMMPEARREVTAIRSSKKGIAR